MLINKNLKRKKENEIKIYDDGGGVFSCLFITMDTGQLHFFRQQEFSFKSR